MDRTARLRALGLNPSGWPRKREEIEAEDMSHPSPSSTARHRFKGIDQEFDGGDSGGGAVGDGNVRPASMELGRLFAFPSWYRIAEQHRNVS